MDSSNCTFAPRATDAIFDMRIRAAAVVMLHDTSHRDPVQQTDGLHSMRSLEVSCRAYARMALKNRLTSGEVTRSRGAT